MRQSKMSGRSKKILAVFLAAAMIAGNALTVLAEDVSGNNVETVEEKVEDKPGKQRRGFGGRKRQPGKYRGKA